MLQITDVTATLGSWNAALSDICKVASRLALLMGKALDKVKVAMTVDTNFQALREIIYFFPKHYNNLESGLIVLWRLYTITVDWMRTSYMWAKTIYPS